MEDKITNMMIAVIFIIVILLAGIFGFKLFSSKKEVAAKPIYEISNSISKTEITDTTSTNTANMNQTSTENTNISNTSNNENINTNTNTNTNININSNTNTNTNINTNSNTSIPSKTANTTVEAYQYNNRYYYKQLNNYSKAIYDTIIKNMDKLTTGNYTMKIDYDFSKLLSDKNDSKNLEGYYGDAINALNLDIPNLFYIDLSKFCLRVETETSILGTKYELYIDSGDNENYFINGFNSKIDVEQAITNVEAIKNYVLGSTKGEEYTKIKLAHDWIIDYLEYKSSSTNKSTVYGALMEKEAICEGYARTYKYFLDNLGIENILVTGIATNSSNQTEEHMWNFVKLDNNWYAVDCTWDDPIVHGGGTIGYDVKHRYFLIGSEELSKTHVIKKTISPNGNEFRLPELSINKY